MFSLIKHNIHFLIIVSIILVTSCTNSTKQLSQKYTSSSEVPVIDTLFISSDYKKIKDNNYNASTTKFIILKEDDNTMFADINQVIDAFGKYFIVDTYGSRRVVSFDHNGNPLASYGKQGNGPGEYVFPWDVDVSSEYVYILDISQRKLIQYNHKGEFINCKHIPFESKGFTLLNNGKLLFKLEPFKDTNNYQLCVTDSMLNPINYMLRYPDGYVGGWVTNAVFQKNKNGISYYCSPADTIYHLDYDGKMTGKRFIKYQNGPIHELAKLNFIEADNKGKITSGMHLLNNPVELSNGICFMEVTDYTNKGTYTVMFSPQKGITKIVKFGDNMSVNDVIIPCTSNKDEQVISYIDRMIADKCYDFKTMPDSMIKALDEGFRLLVINNIH